MSHLYANSRALRPKDDTSLRVLPQSSFAFAGSADLAPITESEAGAAAREFVIVFPHRSPGLPQLVLSLGDGCNAYVDAQGRWLAGFVPSHVANYPFSLAEQPADQSSSEAQRLYMMEIVPDAPHFSQQDGVRLFNDDASPTPSLRKIEERLVSAQAQIERTQFLVQQIEDCGLLKVDTLPVRIGEARAIGLAGAKVIDREKFEALASTEIEKLRTSGALGLIQAHLLSLRNLAQSVLQQHAARVKAGGSTGAEGALLAHLKAGLARAAARPEGTPQAASDAAARMQAALAKRG